MNDIIIRNSLPSKLDRDLDYILLDGSGSMMDKWWPMLGAIDRYIKDLKVQAVSTHTILHVFDDCDRERIHRDCTIEDWLFFSESKVECPGGMTPLYDAIFLMARTVRDLNPKKATILIVTDGEDSGPTTNKYCNLDTARALIQWLRDLGHQVIFFGCDFDNDAQARALGANASNSIGVRQNKLLEAASELAKKRTQHSRTGEGINFSDAEKEKFGGFLPSHNGH